MKGCGVCHPPEQGTEAWEEVKMFQLFLRLSSTDEGTDELNADPTWREYMNLPEGRRLKRPSERDASAPGNETNSSDLSSGAGV